MELSLRFINRLFCVVNDQEQGIFLLKTTFRGRPIQYHCLTVKVGLQLFQLRLSTSKAEKSNMSAKGYWESL